MKFRSLLALLIVEALIFAPVHAQEVRGTSPLSIAKGGTAANTAAGARTNLGLGAFATQTPPCTTTQGCTGISNATNAANDLLASNGTNGNFVHTAPLTVINAVCTLSPGTCTSFFGYANVLWYGASCNGVTHDEVAFQNALNATIAGSIPLQLPVGNCVLNANITNGTSLFTETIIQGYGSDSVVSFLSNFGFAFNAQASYYNLHDFELTCQSSSSSACLKIYNATQSSALSSIIRNLYISNCGAYCMYFQNMTETQLTHNSITPGSTSSYGIYIDNSQTADVGGNLIDGNLIVNIAASPALDGIYFLNVGGTRTIGNAIDGFGYDIYYSSTLASGAATGIQILNNQLDDFVNAGVWFNNGNLGGSLVHVNVQGNTLHAKATATGTYGIAFAIAAGSSAWVLNAAVGTNTIDTAAGNGGVVVQGVTGIAVVGNSITDQGVTAGNAISTDAHTTNCTVTGNAINQYTSHVSTTCTAIGNN